MTISLKELTQITYVLNKKTDISFDNIVELYDKNNYIVAIDQSKIPYCFKRHEERNIEFISSSLSKNEVGDIKKDGDKTSIKAARKLIIEYIRANKSNKLRKEKMLSQKIGLA